MLPGIETEADFVLHSVHFLLRLYLSHKVSTALYFLSPNLAVDVYTLPGLLDLGLMALALSVAVPC